MLTTAWSLLQDLKNWSYDHQIMDSLQVPCPILSIGNLTMGGTGKTPVVRWWAERFLGRGKRVAIISRNYNATSKTIRPVDLEHPNPAQFFGDEPTMLKSLLPKADVYVGPRKYETAFQAWVEKSPDLMIVDDGFQHRALHRNFDLVLIDTSGPQQVDLFPRGSFREGVKSLRRASAVLLTKTNWAAPGAVDQWRSQIPPGCFVAESESTLLLPRQLEGPVAAMAGLARPDSFRQSVESHLGRTLSEFWGFPDHHIYRPMDLRPMEQWLEKNPDGVLLITEKDAIKLGPWMERVRRVAAVPLQMVPGRGFDEMAAKVDRLVP